jgi:hypothetical protein
MGIRSILRQPVIQLAEPMSLQGIETENSRRFGPVVREADEPIAFQVAEPVAPQVEKPAVPIRRQTPKADAGVAVGQRAVTPRSPVFPAQPRLAQARQVPGLTRPESLPPPSPVRDDHDPGIKPMRDIRIDITPPIETDVSGQPRSPEDFASQAFEDQPRFPRDPPPSGPWFGDAAYGPPLNFCYRPLYFEEANFERYGRTAGILQPLVSAGHFYGGVAVLPYRLAAQRPGFSTCHEHCYRPGAPAPREWQAPRVRLDAATVQAAAVMGLIFLIP